MKKLKKLVAVILTLIVLSSIAVITVSAKTEDALMAEANASTGITVHYYSESGSVPKIYYWNSLPVNIETEYPGVNMKSEGGNWFSYEFAGKTKINMLFIENGNESKELTRESAGEYWYKNNRWYNQHPDFLDTTDRIDFREETIYFVITTRFYDGDTGNNVHCWDDSRAGNPDSDPAWKGDFQGLIDKLDYIKALGFSAVWITPVVTNASGYDYHGYHAMDFGTVDVRYESAGATFQDLIDAVHEKDMKIIQDVVWNHSGNFGEAGLAPMFTKEYSDIKDLESADSMVMIKDSELAKSFPNYDSLDPDSQFQARLAIMKNTDGQNHDVNDYYHHSKDMSWESYTEQTGQIAGDCVDINTENPVVAKYITDTYMDYVNMGVDSFRIDTVKHINRWTLNSAYFPVFNEVENFFMFSEVCVRVHDLWNHGVVSSSMPFWTWAETDSKWKNNWSTTDHEANLANSIAHYQAQSAENQPTSNNAFLNGNEYHTPDHSQASGSAIIDFRMHWAFSNASQAFYTGKDSDAYVNDATYNVMYVDSHDYGPDSDNRYNGGTQAWAENLNLMYTFRGIPCLYYGSEIEFQKGVQMDVGPNAPLSETGRAYFGDNIEGSVTATGFGTYENASGKVAETLNNPLAKHIQRLSQIRQAIPALQKGQYSTNDVSGNIAYKRRFTDSENGVDSFVCVTVSGGATFSNIPNGTYIDAVSGDVKNVTNGTLTIASPGTANMRAYVLSSGGFTGISGAIGTAGTYLK